MDKEFRELIKLIDQEQVKTIKELLIEILASKEVK